MSMAVGIAVGAAIAASSHSGGSSCPMTDFPWWLAVSALVMVLTFALLMLEMLSDLMFDREIIGFNAMGKVLGLLIISGLVFSIGGTFHYC